MFRGQNVSRITDVMLYRLVCAVYVTLLNPLY